MTMPSLRSARFSTRSAPRKLAAITTAAMLVSLAGWSVASANDDLLKGPSVSKSTSTNSTTATQDYPFAQAAGDQPVPFRVFIQAVRSLEPHRNTTELALSEDQQALINKLVASHNEALLKYVQLHRAEIQALLPQADLPQPRQLAPGREGGPGRRPGAGERPSVDDAAAPPPPRRRANPGHLENAPENGPGPMQDNPEAHARQQVLRMFAQLQFSRVEPSLDPEVNAARQRLIELREGAPSPDETQAAVWAALNADQQQQVTTLIEKTFRERAERQRGRDMTTDRQNRPGAAPPAPQGQPDMGDRQPPRRRSNRPQA